MTEEAPKMADGIHRFKVGQTVDPFRRRGTYRIVSLRMAEDGNAQYRIKSRSEVHERVVSEGDILTPNLNFD